MKATRRPGPSVRTRVQELTASGAREHEDRLALAAGVGALVAVGAPSSLTVDLARRGGLVLYSFTSEERAVRYA